MACITLLISLALILFASSRQPSGLPGPVSEAMLTDLRDMLQNQGSIPELPEGWRSQSAMLAANDVGYGGDFLVANIHEGRKLELILVDVVGKGVGAAARALQFGGALGGLIGALPPRELFAAANNFLVRQNSDETFATAVHVLTDLETGEYQLTSAGHPTGARWSQAGGQWDVDRARGTALGIVPSPELHRTEWPARPRRRAALLHRRRDRDPHVGSRQRHRLAPADSIAGHRSRLRRGGPAHHRGGEPRRRRPGRADPGVRRRARGRRAVRQGQLSRLPTGGACMTGNGTDVTGGVLRLAHDLTLTRMGYGAMQLAGPGVFGPPARPRAGASPCSARRSTWASTTSTPATTTARTSVNELIREALHPYPEDLHLVTKVGARRAPTGRWPPALRRTSSRSAVHDNLRPPRPGRPRRGQPAGAGEPGGTGDVARRAVRSAGGAAAAGSDPAPRASAT